jgi:hypothetical protein
MNWETAEQAGARVNRHRDTLHKAARAGLLHGHQRGRKCRWAFAPAAVDAYTRGEVEAAQKKACGCERVALRAVS